MSPGAVLANNRAASLANAATVLSSGVRATSPLALAVLGRGKPSRVYPVSCPPDPSGDSGCPADVVPASDAPIILSEPVLSVLEYEPYSDAVRAVDPDDQNQTPADDDILSFSLTTTPPGMTIISSTGEVSWLPQAEHIGERPVTIEVSDGTLTDTQPYALTVENVNDPPVVDPMHDKQVGISELLEFTVTWHDPDDDLPYRAPSGVISITGLRLAEATHPEAQVLPILATSIVRNS